MSRHASFFNVVRVPAFQLPVSIHGGNQRAGIANDSRRIAEVIALHKLYFMGYPQGYQQAFTAW